MKQFKVGDKVRRIYHKAHGASVVGCVYTVIKVYGGMLVVEDVDGSEFSFDPEYFESVEE
jgi:hypothetical protein